MRVIAPLAVALAACGDSSATHGFSSEPVVLTLPQTSSADSTSTGSDAGGTSSTGVASTSTGEPPQLDMGTPPDFGPGQPEGCKGKIDFVFVISRYGNMVHYQDNLLASFDGFMATVAAEFSEFDTHIMVANPDGEWPGYGCNTYFCPKYGHCGPGGEDYVCGSQPLDPICDAKLGAGLLYNVGRNATNVPCVLAEGRRYMTKLDLPHLAEEFACLARVGTISGSPKLGGSLVEVVSPELNAPDGCNAGFLRPDALLVAVFISDVTDVWSLDWPYEWYDAVVAAKGGDPDAIVVLSILAPPKVDWPEPDCLYDGNPPGNRMYEFTEMFPHHVIASVCEDSYVPAFAQTAALVQEACAGFIPQ